MAGKSANNRSSRPSLDLSGEWDFKIDPFEMGQKEKWFEKSHVFERKMPVPGAWNAMGAEYPTEQLLHEYEKKILDERDILGPKRESEIIYHVYPGPAWYRKTVTIPVEWAGRIPWLVFGGVHREATVWVNGSLAGSHHSYLTPLRIDLSRHAEPGERITIVVRIDARRKPESDPAMGCLDTLDFLFISWGGLHRKVTLESTASIWIEDVFVAPKPEAETAEVCLTLSGEYAGPLEVAAEISEADGASVAMIRKAVAGIAGETLLAARIPNPKLWSPETPHLYSARINLLSDGKVLETRMVRFGMREFKVEGAKFLLNGKPIFLRGYGDDCIFPNTICPPDDANEFRSRLSLAREYGFNYVRHHSWVPPEEYLDAADELGMMIQPEFPFAYRWDLPATPEAKQAALEQWKAMIRLNRNHPSIVTWCMGNELYDSFDLAPEMYRSAKNLDPTRPVIDSDGFFFSKNKDRETLDFLVVQYAESASIGFQDTKYGIPEDVTKPVVAHEMGYFVTLPDLAQIDLFRSGLRPYWLYQARDLATRKGVLQLYPEWLVASYHLQAVCLKSNLEAARRSGLSGTSVWLFQDYPNCAEGVLDMFFRPKALLPEEFRKFNAPTVLLLDAPRRNWWSGETATVKFLVSRFEDDPSDSSTLRWQLLAGPETIAAGVQERLQVNSGGIQELLPFNLDIPRRARAERFTLAVELTDDNGKTQNSWDLWVFPNDPFISTSQRVRTDGSESVIAMCPWALEQTANPSPDNTDLLLTTHLGEEVIGYLKAGGRVFLLDPETAFTVEKTNFRASSWDGGGPSGTIVERNHPALRGMPSEGWCDLQFYHLIQGSKTISLDPLSTKVQPLIRCIDRPDRLEDRAYLFEVSVGRGKLLVSGFNFAQAIELKDPAAVYFFDRLLQYELGPDFAPPISLREEDLNVKGK